MRTRLFINILLELWLIGTRADVAILEVAVIMLAGVVVSATVISLEFVIEVAYVVEVVADVWAGAKFGDVSGTCAEVNKSDMTAVMSALEFVLPSPLEEPFHCS